MEPIRLIPISEPTPYTKKTYYRNLKWRFDTREYSFLCEPTGEIMDWTLDSWQKKELEKFKSAMGTSSVIDLGLTIKERVEHSPKVSACPNCGLYLIHNRILICRGCKLAFEENGEFSAQLTDYFRMQRENGHDITKNRL